MPGISLYDLTSGVREAEPGFFVTDALPQAEWIRRYAVTPGTTLRARAEEPLTTSALDLPLYRTLLEKTLAGVNRSACVVELGAGDGRITHELLRLGFDDIIAVEGNPSGLKTLHASLSPEQRNRVRLLCADILTLRLPEGSADVLVSIEALSYLGENFEAVLASLARTLTPNGVLAHAELMQEGNLLYALAAQDTEHIRALLGQQWPTAYGMARAFTEEEMAAIHTRAGLRMRESARIPALHGLVSLARQRHDACTPALHDTLLQAAELLRGCNAPRAMYFAGGRSDAPA